MAKAGRKKFDYLAVTKNKKSLNDAYQDYLYSYKVREANMNRKGFEMRDKLFTKSEFSAFYVAQGNELAEEGRTASTRTIISELVDRASYKYSRKQAKAFQKILKEQGQDAPTQQAIMAGAEIDNKAIYDRISEARRKFREEHYGKMTKKDYWKAESHYIGTTFFGSP